MGKLVVRCFYTLPLRDHTFVKLLVNLKKYALQDDTKVLEVYWIMFNVICWEKQNKFNVSFGLIISELRRLCT